METWGMCVCVCVLCGVVGSGGTLTASLLIKNSRYLEAHIIVLFINQTTVLRDLNAGRKEGTFVRLFTSVYACGVGK